MKRCPTCKRTFEDSLTYCLVDGSVLSAPFEETEADRDSRATDVFSDSAGKAAATEPVAPARTIPAAFVAEPLQPQQKLTPAESKPVALIGIIGLVTVLYSVAIVILLVINWQVVSPYFGWLILRRTPIFILVFAGIIVALARMRRHMRASLLTVLALIIYLLEGFAFYLLTSSVITLMSKMQLSPSIGEWVYFILYFVEDFIFAGVLILLVAAAFSGRNQFSKLTTETS